MIVKHVPVLETIGETGEDMTESFSKKKLTGVLKSSNSLIRDSITVPVDPDSKHSILKEAGVPVAVSAPVVVATTPKIKMDTPKKIMKLALRDIEAYRRKSIASPGRPLPAETEKPIHSKSQHNPMHALLKAINSRRKSIQPPVQTTDTSITDEPKITMEKSPIRRRPFLLAADIHARRKSFAQPKVETEKDTAVDDTSTKKSPSLQKNVMSMGLKRAIEERRRKSIAPISAEEPSETISEEVRRKSIATPTRSKNVFSESSAMKANKKSLFDQILAKRKSYSVQVEEPRDVTSTPSRSAVTSKPLAHERPVFKPAGIATPKAGVRLSSPGRLSVAPGCPVTHNNRKIYI